MTFLAKKKTNILKYHFFYFLIIVCTSFHEIKMRFLWVPQQASIWLHSKHRSTLALTPTQWTPQSRWKQWTDCWQGLLACIQLPPRCSERVSHRRKERLFSPILQQSRVPSQEPVIFCTKRKNWFIHFKHDQKGNYFSKTGVQKWKKNIMYMCIYVMSKYRIVYSILYLQFRTMLNFKLWIWYSNYMYKAGLTTRNESSVDVILSWPRRSVKW